MGLAEREMMIHREINERRSEPGIYTQDAIAITVVRHLALIEERIDKICTILKIDK